jgi:oxygen-independent coproporphyrinogen-3 oxidase
MPSPSSSRLSFSRDASAVTDRLRAMETGESDLALYIHWPFCVSKCPYCDFNSHVRSHVDQDEWREALLADLAHEASLLPGRRLTSIFFGGGTPSLMPPATVAALIEAAAGHWAVAPGLEITLEANPSSVEAARFGDLAAAGVNRVSLGLQALDDRTLGWLGRAHGVTESLKALSTAQSLFERVSIDLIYARPEQSLDQWLTELEQALAFGTEHVSLYQLTIEPGTQFATRFARGELVPLDPDAAALQFEATRARMAAAGLPAYETSNHARPGAESRHNLTYWRYGNYAGIGPGAHGRRDGVATARRKKPENWLRRVGENGHGIEVAEKLSGRERAQEALIMGLRLVEGVDLARIARLSAVPVEQLVDRQAVVRLERQGLVQRNEDRLRVSDAGALLLDGILADIVTA